MAVNKLVASIIQFLTQQLEEGDITADSKESLEVAIQCLESAYNVQASDAPKNINLLDLYKEIDNSLSSFPSKTTTATASETLRPPTSPLPPEATPEAKANAEALKNEGNQLMRMGKYQESLANYTKAIELDGRNAVFYGNRAAVYSRLGDHQSAIKDCYKALQIDPTYSKAYGRLGLAYSGLKNHKEAIEAYKKALEMEPENESYKTNLHLAEEQLAQGNSGAQNMIDMHLMSVMNNPALINIAQQMMREPFMQNLMMNSVGGDNNSLDNNRMDTIVEVGQRLLQRLQNSNPDALNSILRGMSQNPNQDPPQQN